jgi:DNA-directed RNA polymerase specialized sigma24 family protein
VVDGGVLDSERCDRLTEKVLDGDADAGRELISVLWPEWVAHARSSRSLGSLRRSDDTVREIATRLAEKIAKPSGALRLYAPWREQHPEKTFADWIRIVTSNAIRDYVRETIGTSRVADGELSRKRLLNEFWHSTGLDAVGVRPPFTAKETARQLMEFSTRHLPALQVQALELWLAGSSYDEMSQTLGTDAAGARDLMRAAVAALRRNFGEQR